MIINNNNLNSLPQQVEENMKNIKLLASYLKEAYKTSLDLGDSAVSIAISDTNATADTTDGWLITNDGYLYKITNGDGTNLLLEYYTRLKGKNASDDIDDNTTSTTKLWSSQKTSDKIDLISDKGIYYTLVQPTLNGSLYELNTSDLANPNQYTFQKYNDIIVYIDSDGKVKELYNCVSVQADFSKIYLEKVGEIGGKQMYQHNISVYQNDNNSNAFIRAKFTITNDSDTPLNTMQLLVNYFIEKFGLTENDYTKGIEATGIAGNSNPQSIIFAVCLGDTYNNVRRLAFAHHGINGAFYIQYISINNVWNNYTITDNVIPQ